MPNTSQIRIYWDSCVWLAYVNGDIPERMPTIDALLKDSASHNGRIHLVTSELALVEVAFGLQEQKGRTLDAAVEANIDKMWEDRDSLSLIEYHSRIGRSARSLIREAMTKDWHLRAIDAVHLATAQWLTVTEFHTYDDKLWRFSEIVGFPVEQPSTMQIGASGKK